jgi:nucleoside-diphosphate-sugar epimerase
LSKKTLLITGASGLCGSYLTNFFMKKDLELYTTSRKKSNKKYNISCDLTDFDDLKKLPKKVDYIIHCASVVDEINSDFKILENNLKIGFNLSHYIHQKKPKCFINLSSISVYGYPDNRNIDENFLMNPISQYGYSKVINEQLFLNTSSKNTRILNLRLGYVLTPKIPSRYFISRLIDMLKNNKTVTLFEPSKNFFNFIDIDDVCKSCLYFLDSKASGSFNVVMDIQPNLQQVFDELKTYFPNFSSKILIKHSTQINKCVISNQKLKKIMKFSFTPYCNSLSKIILNDE